MTPAGLRAVLDFTYLGKLTLDLSKEGVEDKVLNSCRCLEMERPQERCMSKVATSAAKEKKKNMTIIKDLLERGVECDETIQVEERDMMS